MYTGDTKMPFTYNYARPALTVDCVVFGLNEADLKVLLIQRDLELRRTLGEPSTYNMAKRNGCLRNSFI